ncbi:hypothetical protein U9M48_036666 [Paspalum notatum var. saurae]|uniref:Uncharacterized protein n=1 Tax=Paspalum notatum var. saurae TaxID=547442 RepID=A0AAQ3XBD8_PASNO
MNDKRNDHPLRRARGRAALQLLPPACDDGDSSTTPPLQHRHSQTAAQVQQQTAGALPSATTHARASTATRASAQPAPAPAPAPRPPLPPPGPLAGTSLAPTAEQQLGPLSASSPSRAGPAATGAPPRPPRLRSRLHPGACSLSSCSAAASPARSRARFEPLAAALRFFFFFLFLIDSLLEKRCLGVGDGGALGDELMTPTRRGAPPPPPSMEDRLRRCMGVCLRDKQGLEALLDCTSAASLK